MTRRGRLRRVIAAGAAALVSGAVSSGPATGAPSPRHRAIAIDAGSLQLRGVRAGSGPTILLLHGYGESLLAWQGVFDLLARQADVVALDLPGFGLSSKPVTGYATDSLAATILRAMDALGTESVVLAGHSLGGAVAAAVAVAAPEKVRGLVLVDPAVVRSGWMRGAGQTSPTTRDVIGRGIAAYEAARMRFSGVHDREWMSESDSAMAYTPAADPEYLQSLQAVLREFDFDYLDPDRSIRLRMPVMIVWGMFDPTVSVKGGRALARRLSTAEFHVVSRSWHRPHVERPAEVAALISRFLGRLAAVDPPGH